MEVKHLVFSPHGRWPDRVRENPQRCYALCLTFDDAKSTGTAACARDGSVRNGSLLFAAEEMRDVAKRKLVSVRAKPGHHGGRRERHVGVMAKRLSLVDVRNVHLENRARTRFQRVHDRN